MPELKCSVQTCVHNQNFLCNLDSIQVGGESAKKSEETSCNSFSERAEGGYSNSTITERTASDCAKVDCKAVECMYNKDCNCHAGKISVEGHDADTTEETECATFHYK